MQLTHYSRNLVEAVYSVPQSDTIEGFYDKPKGLWVSVDGEQDWAAWCESEEFKLESLEFPHRVKLHPSSKILALSSPLDIDVFTEKYGVGSPPSIDWERVAEDYQGIIIAPYCWARRMSGHTRWYYGWDCASGCIWDASAIELIAAREKAQEVSA